MPSPGIGSGGDPRSLPIHSLGAAVTITCSKCGCPQKCSCDVPILLTGDLLRLDLPAGVNGALGRAWAVPAGVGYSIDDSTNLLDRAASYQNIAARVGVGLPQFPIPGECTDPSGPCGAWMNLDGSLARQVGTPASGGFAPQLILSYNSASASLASEFGYGWCCNYNSSVSLTSSPAGALLTDAIGSQLQYTGSPGAGSLYTPPPGAIDSLQNTGSGFALIQPSGMTLNYDSGGNLSTLQNSAGIWTLIRSGGLIRTITDPTGGVSSLSYDGSNKLSMITDPAGRNTSFSIVSGELRRVTSPTLCITAIGYDAHHLLTGWTTPSGITATYAYDGSSRLSSARLPNGTSTIAYASGTVAITDPRNHTTTYAVNLSDGTLASLTDPLNRTTAYAWDTGWPAAITDALGATYSFSYASLTQDPGLVRLQSIQLPGGGIFTYLLDSSDRLQTIIDELGNVGTLSWSSNLRTSFQNPLGKYTSYGYDNAQFNQLASITNPLNNTFNLTWDASGIQTADINPLGQATMYTANAAGQRIAVQDPLNHVSSCTRDDSNRILTCTDPLNHTSTFTFESGTGRLIAQTNPRGYTTTFTFDTSGRPQNVIDPLGFRITNLYDAANNLIFFIDQRGNWTTFTVDAANQTIARQDPLGNITTYGRDAVGNVTTLTNALGFVTTSVFDSQRRRTVEVNALGYRTTSTYDLASNLLSIKDALNKLWSTTFDELNLPQTTTDPLGNVTTTIRDDAARAIAMVNALGYATTFMFDTANRPSAVMTPLGEITTTMRDVAGRPIATVDARGNTWTTVFDDANRPIAAIDPLSNCTSTMFDAADNVIGTQNALGNIWTTVRDPLNRPIATVDPLNYRASTSYDPAGNQLTATDQMGKVTTYVTDAANRRTVVIDPLGHQTSTVYDNASQVIAYVNALGNRTTITRDPVGQPIAVVDALHHATTATFDPRGQQTALTDANLHTTTTVFDDAKRQIATVNALGYATTQMLDAVGNLTALVDANNHRTTFQYDPNNRNTVQIDPLNRKTTFGYDPVGNQVTRQNARGELTTYVWDDSNHLTGRQYADGSRVTQMFDAAYQRTTLVDSTGTTKFTFTARGETAAMTTPANLTVGYTFEAIPNLRTGMQIPGGGKFTYIYDLAQRLDQLVNPDGDATTFTRDAANRPTLQQMANGTSASMIYDAADRLENLINLRANGDVISSFGYQYDNANNRTGVLEANNDHVTWAYDAANQLRNEARSGVLAPYNITHTWDPVGNRLYKDDLVTGHTTSTYDAANQLQTSQDSTGTTTFTFDLTGNQQLEQSPTGLITTNVWDMENRLVGVALPGGVPNTMAYNGDSQRVLLQDSSGTKKFVMDGQAYLLETDDSNNITVAYTQAPEQFGNLISQDAGGTKRFYHFDGLGSTSRLSDSSGNALSDIYIFDAFGNRRSVDSLPLPSFLFIGKLGYYFDPDSGRSYVRMRIYNPVSARWISQDPIGLQPDANPFRYVGNNPATLVDSTGLGTCTVALKDEVDAYYARQSKVQGMLGKLLSDFFQGLGKALGNSPRQIQVGVNGHVLKCCCKINEDTEANAPSVEGGNDITIPIKFGAINVDAFKFSIAVSYASATPVHRCENQPGDKDDYVKFQLRIVLTFGMVLSGSHTINSQILYAIPCDGANKPCQTAGSMTGGGAGNIPIPPGPPKLPIQPMPPR